MKRKLGCIFMSMILFFGVAVMGWTQRGKTGLLHRKHQVKNHTHLQQKKISEREENIPNHKKL